MSKEVEALYEAIRGVISRLYGDHVALDVVNWLAERGYYIVFDPDKKAD